MKVNNFLKTIIVILLFILVIELRIAIKALYAIAKAIATGSVPF